MQSSQQISEALFPYNCTVIERKKSDEKISLQSQIQSLKRQLQPFLLSRKTIVLVVNDATRSTQTEFILKQIIPLLEKKQYRIIIATGTHQKPSHNNLQQIFGSLLPTISSKLIFHNARSKEHVYLGKTSFGNAVWVNRIVGECDAIITINSVEPHYFAGFTGGRKSILPGIAAYETIEYNHQLAMNEKARNLNLSDNPVHLDMEEGVSFLKTPVFSIQLGQDWQQNIQNLSFGTMRESFSQAVEIAKKVYTVPVSQKAEIIIAEVENPLHKTFYQAHKALENGRTLLKKGGIFIVVAACEEGIGNATFVEQLNAFQTLKEVMENCTKTYQLGAHKAYRIAAFLQESQFWLVSDIQEQIIKQKHFRNETDFYFALQAAISIKGTDCSMFHIKQAGSIAPVFVG